MLSELDDDECRRLLGNGGRGRVVHTEHALPAVAPTRYVVWGDRLWFAVPRGTALTRHPDGGVLAYHVDEVDLEARSGWSVTVLGTARSEPFRSRPAVARTLGPDDQHVVALDMSRFSGRRLGRTSAPV